MTLDDRAGGLAARIRPYAVTGGRTRGNRYLALETIVRTTPQGRAAHPRLVMESARVVEMCSEPLSVAEVSSHLQMPLGVARVIVGDLVAEELLAANAASGPNSTTQNRPDIKLLERVLDGLQAL